MTAYTSVAVFLFSALALVVPSGFSLGAALLLVGALALLHPAARQARLAPRDWLLVGAFLLFFTVNVLDNLLHHAPLAEYDAPLRFVLALPALLLLRAWPPRGWALWSGAAAGAIGAGMLSLWQLLKLHQERPSGSTNPIQYGNIGLLLGLLCLCGLLWAVREQRGAGWVALLVGGTVMGLLASLLSGSRGSWLAAPACLLAAVYPMLRCGHGLLLMKIIIAAIASVALLWQVPQSGLRMRAQVAVSEAGQYQQANEANSSIGARMEMLRAGLLMAPQHLLLGWGKQGMFDYKASLVDQGLAAASIRDHTHLHNEYLDAIVKRGIPGLLAVLGLYLLPLHGFVQVLRAGSRRQQPYAIGGIMLLVSYLTFGLTQVFLSHNNGVMILAFLLVILWGLARRPMTDQGSALESM